MVGTSRRVGWGGSAGVPPSSLRLQKVVEKSIAPCPVKSRYEAFLCALLWDARLSFLNNVIHLQNFPGIGLDDTRLTDIGVLWRPLRCGPGHTAEQRGQQCGDCRHWSRS